MVGSLPTLRAAPFSFPSQRTRPGPTSLSNPAVLSAKTASPSPAAAKAAAGGCATKLSAWTSIRQERWEGDLAVDGHLPLWLNGTYLRNGPGVWEVGDDGSALDHLFDGYATLVRVSFRRGRAAGAHRQLESDAYRAAKERGRPLLREFGHCPAKPASPADRARGVVGLVTGGALSDNANVAVLPLGDGRVMCLTETTRSSVLVDPCTLATLGKFRYADALGGVIQAGHPVVTGSELWTLLPDLVRPGHRLVRMAAGSSERKVVGRVGCTRSPSRRTTSSCRRCRSGTRSAACSSLSARSSTSSTGSQRPGAICTSYTSRPGRRWQASRCRFSWQSTSSTRTRRKARTGRLPRSSPTAASTTLILQSLMHLLSTG
ncbi:hypothetical protein PVAP13_5KG548400 [Panicum virgatum]|uniref:Uncharacterized protein n=1 Tax=Panicum virgatum TaxID=38727 RepID=A0A8T0SPQ4_PANVG|nr:hypothetical protein PVAP13_5KG548400 [Panicum virgatum]